MIKQKIEHRLGAVIGSFLQSQLGEAASSVQAVLSGNTLAVRATDCLTPAERTLAQEESGWHLLQNYKAQQFDHAQPVLKDQLEGLLGCEIADIVTALSKDGVRFEMVTFSEDVEHKLHNLIGEAR